MATADFESAGRSWLLGPESRSCSSASASPVPPIFSDKQKCQQTLMAVAKAQESCRHPGEHEDDTEFKSCNTTSAAVIAISI